MKKLRTYAVAGAVITVASFGQAQEQAAGSGEEAPPAVAEPADAEPAPGTDDSAAQEEAASDQSKDETPEDASAKNSKAGADGARFRFGVSGGPGFFKIADQFGNSTGVVYGGVDLRFGVQLNDMIGIYAQPVLGYYSLTETGFANAGGLLGASLGADATFLDRLFVGAGVGYHIYNNPGGPSLLMRVGGYPLMGKSKKKVRRKGLMLGVDLRLSFLSGYKTIAQPTFNIGYEAF